MIRPGVFHKLRLLVAAGSVGVLLLALPAAAAFGQTSDFDDWQGFKPGSWCEIRTTVETMDALGTTVAAKSTSITQTELASIAKDSVTLRVNEGTIEYAGKRFPTPAATLVLRPYGQQENEKATVAEQGKVEIELGGEKHQCRTVKVQLAGETGKREVVNVFRDAAVQSPLRRVVTAFDKNAEEKVVSTTTTEALTLDGAVPVGERMLRTVCYRVVYRNHKLSTTALVDKSADVPGQLVRAEVVERGPDGTLLRRITQELLDYEVKSEAVPSTEIGRARERREARQDRREERRIRRSPSDDR